MNSLKLAANGSLIKVVSITDAKLAARLQTCGIFTDSMLTKIDNTYASFKTLKVQGPRGSIAIPGHMADVIKMQKDEASALFSLYEFAEGEQGVVSAIDSDNKSIHFWAEQLGITKGKTLKLHRKLPHMEYRLLVGNKRRAKISEAHAASIIGHVAGKRTQLSFAKKDAEFEVALIFATETIENYLQSIGISAGVKIILEGIAPGKDVIFDSDGTINLYSMDGFRLLVNEETADKIIVSTV